MPDYKLGRKAPQRDERTLMLGRYVSPELEATAPAELRYDEGIGAWPMYMNDQESDCTCAAAGHMVQVWDKLMAGGGALASDSDVQALYNAVNGGQDGGAIMLDVLRYWQANGFAGLRPTAYAEVNELDLGHVRLAAWMFGGLYCGVNMPLSAKRASDVWTVGQGDDAVPGSWGGHCMNLVGYDALGVTFVTWGRTQRANWAWWNTYAEEAWAVLPNSWANAAKEPVPGFDFVALLADLALLKQQS